MVLEEIPSDPDPYSSPSSSDPFQSSSSDSTNHSIDFSNLPRSIPFSWLWGFTQARLRERITLDADTMSRLLQRRLRPEELEAVCYHRARNERLSSLGAPLGLAAAQYRVHTTKEEGRFPFQKFFKNTNWAFNGDVLSYAGRELVRGPRAAVVVDALRSSCYLSIGYWLGTSLLRSYGTSLQAAGIMRDKRLEEYDRALTKASRERRGLPPGGQSRSRPTSEPNGSQRPDPTGQGSRSAGELWKNHRTAIGGNSQDDASPTAGNNEDFFGLGSSTGPGDGVSMNDSQMRTKDRRQQPPQPPRDFTSDYTSSTPSTDDSSYASPSASSGQSAWDRIRRETASGGGSTPSMGRGGQMRRGGPLQQEKQEGSTLDDNFSFSRTEEERSYAKDEAQKQFDERVDQERRGEDFGARGSRR